MKVQLVQASPETGPWLDQGWFLPLGLLATASYLETVNANVDIEVLDGSHLGSSDLLSRLDGDIVGVNYTILSTDSLDRIVETSTLDVLKLITDKLDSLEGAKSFELRNWLKGGMFNTGKSIIELLPIKKLLSWIDEDPEKRARLISETLSPILNLEKNCKVREILKKYGDQKEVRLSLLRTFATDSFMGSEVTHYQNKIEKMKQLYEQETEPNVRLWIKEHISSLEEDVKRAERHEERWD